MTEINEKIIRTGVVPVIKLNHPQRDAEPLARALCAGGVPVAEVTFRAAGAAEAIRIMTEKCPEMLVGAGTVLTAAQVDEALAAGARFIVTPGLDVELASYCLEKGAAVYPGCTTPTDYHAALKLGLEVLKFFPAEPSGGLGMIKALAAPYTQVKFIPTGGITAANVGEYLLYNRIVACGGSWMVKKDLINAGQFDKIRLLAAEAAAIVKTVREGK